MSEIASPVLPAEVLTKAIVRASELLGFSRTDLGRVVGVSAASASRLGRSRLVEPETKEGELCLLFLRIFRSLDVLLGGDREACREWAHAHNEHLGGIPARLMERVEGLVRVAEYVDSMRAKT